MMITKFKHCVGTNVMALQASRTYLAELGLDSNSIALRDESNKKTAELQLWKSQID